VRVISASFLETIYERSTIEVNSIHHQAVDSLGKNLKISARSHHDDEIEAIEHTTLPHYGVQWHPEYLGGHRKLFEWFMSI
jgi:putative glutamine amidotransferase